MKKIFLFLLCLLTAFSLAACNKHNPTESGTNTSTVETSGPEESSTTEPIEPTTSPIESTTEPIEPLDSQYLQGEYNLAKNVQDGVILHAWNWSYNTIKENLKDIAEAGFSTVQTSPVQQSKGYNPYNTDVNGTWWKLYQPVSFSIGDAWLGDAEELTALCAEAETYGIKIICDIVVNHMANVNSYEGYSPEIAQYEPEIYNNTAKYFHSYTISTSDSNTRNQVQGSMSGLPDLVTEDEYIQSRVISLLKECIDCGVSGFRFDAAKHIETPDDGDYASDFWPNVLNASSTYALEKYNREMYYYGEVLNSAGTGRSIESYTKYMSVTDNGTSSNIYSAIGTRNMDKMLENISDYSKTSDASKIVLWVESHDTYMDTIEAGSNPIGEAKVNRVWSIVAARQDATALYFVRPGDAGMGECGTYNWMSQETRAINKFHNAFIGATENYSNNGGYLINERYREGDKKAGVIITNVGNVKNEADISLSVTHLHDGTYYDQITGNEFNCVNGQLTGKMGKSGIIVLYDSPVDIIVPVPAFNVSIDSQTFYNGKYATVKLDIANATKVYYQINDEEKVEVAADSQITIDKTCKLTITAEGTKIISKTYDFNMVEKREGYWCVGNVSEALLSENSCYAWVWGQGVDGSWREIEIIDGVVYVRQQATDYGLLLAFFDKSISIHQASWSLNPAQTQDLGKPLNDDLPYTSNI